MYINIMMIIHSNSHTLVDNLSIIIDIISSITRLITDERSATWDYRFQ